jgi:predicted MFS family arabinose efflux permease
MISDAGSAGERHDGSAIGPVADQARDQIADLSEKAVPPNIYLLGLLLPLGYLGLTILPFWVGTAVTLGRLSASSSGIVASGELLCMALGGILAATLVTRLSARHLARIGGLTAAVGNVLAMLPSPTLLIAGRLIGGAGLGVLNAAVAVGVAKQKRPQQALSVLQMIMLPILAFVTLCCPLVIRLGGLEALFGSVALLALIGALLVEILPKKVSEKKHAALIRSDTPSGKAIAACLGVASYSAAQYSIITYIVLIGAHASLGVDAVGWFLTASIATSMVASGLARLIGERLGLAIPVLASLMVMVLGALLATAGQDAFAFVIGTSLLYFVPAFVTPFAFGLLARLDPAGRFASAFPASIMVGAGLGPAVAGRLAQNGDFGGLGPLAAGFIVAAIALFALSLRGGAKLSLQRNQSA